jgi:histone H3/H4
MSGDNGLQEMFIQRLAKAGHVNASREHRTTVMHKDMGVLAKHTSNEVEAPNTRFSSRSETHG